MHPILGKMENAPENHQGAAHGSRKRFLGATAFGTYAAACALALCLLLDQLGTSASRTADDALIIIFVVSQAFLAASICHLLFDGSRSLWRTTIAGLLTPPLAVVTYCTLLMFPSGMLMIPAGWLLVGLPLAPVGAAAALIYALFGWRRSSLRGIAG